MTQQLTGKKVAILVTDGFEQAELTQPKQALEQAGAQTHIVSPNSDRVQGWNHFDKADFFQVDVPLEQASPANYDALLLPGGVANPDQLRMQPKAVQFIRAFAEASKPIAAICHGPWTLIEAGVVKGRTVTSWESLKTDLQNAGAHWVDQEVVVDNGIITSRKPKDIPAFNQKMIEEFAEGQRSQESQQHRQRSLA
ncbi:type 1 glutamine amidotransferase [Phormidium tenue FACHB-886]|nr:type 1 glutamine amidotransferase [Phormidium tenue FACHB-886]